MKNNKKLYACGVILSILVISSILVILIYQRKNNLNKNVEISEYTIENSDNTESASSSIDKNIEQSKYQEINEVQQQNEVNSQSSKDTDNNKRAQDIKQTNQTQVNETQLENVTPTFVMPVVGEIMREYAKDKLVYSNTLEEWTTHLGIDVRAPKTTLVKASSRGTVTAIKNDPRFGLSVLIEHADGYSTVYSNLLTAEFVTVGEKVEQGETIGTVGNTAAFEIVDEPHLHFEILKNGVQVDPNMFL